jgi:methionyl-tRNA synthetase
MLRRHTCISSAPTTPTARRSCLRPKRPGSAPKSSSPIQESHERDFAAFEVAFDHYDSTHSEENREIDRIDLPALEATAATSPRTIEQFYDPVKAMFLPDRYVKGECPNCGTPDQYGDNCEHCGATYARPT